MSDPGVALIELFAWMTEMILYRLNQVPDRLYVKFLELVGIELASASPARTDLLFTLAAPPEQPIRVPAGTQVGTERGHGEDQIVFMTDTDLMLVNPELVACMTRTGGRFEDHTEEQDLQNSPISVFPSLSTDDALYLGFTGSLERNLIRLDLELSGAAGRGIDPKNPPRVWQSWDGRDWRDTRVLSDTSDGFNTSGGVTLLLSGQHEQLAIGPVRAYWLRCRLIEPLEDGRTYDTSPQLDSVTAVGLGGAVAAHHAEPAPRELIGSSNGEAGQEFVVRRAPVLPRWGNRSGGAGSPRVRCGARDLPVDRGGRLHRRGRDRPGVHLVRCHRGDPLRPARGGQGRPDSPVRRGSRGGGADLGHRLPLRRRPSGQRRRRQAHRAALGDPVGGVGAQPRAGHRWRRRGIR